MLFIQGGFGLEGRRNNVFYAQTTGRKVLNDCTNIDEIGITNMFHFKTFTYVLMGFASTDYRYHYSCCRDGKSRQNKWTKRKTDEKRGGGGKKPSSKLNDVCISRIYATVRGRNGGINVTYIPAHTNHTLSIKPSIYPCPLALAMK